MKITQLNNQYTEIDTENEKALLYNGKAVVKYSRDNDDTEITVESDFTNKTIVREIATRFAGFEKTISQNNIIKSALTAKPFNGVYFRLV